MVLLGVVALALALGLWLKLRSSVEEPSAGPPKVAARPPESSGSAAAPPVAASPEDPAEDPAATEAARIAAAAAEAPRYPVDLDWLRSRIPDNLYWEHGAPTSDVEVAKRRAEAAKRSNEAYGRVLSGEASEQEIRDYYAQKRKLSQDYLALSLLVLEEKGAELPERDRGMFELSAKMHRDRLTQIERDQAEALARRAARP